MSKNWRWFLPGYVWCLPLTLGYLLLVVLPFYRPRKWKWKDGILTCLGGTFHTEQGLLQTRIWGRPNGQTVGALQTYSSEAQRRIPSLRIHENTHTVQFFIGGVVGFVVTPVLWYALGWSPFWGLALGGFLGAIGAGLLYVLIFLWYLARLMKLIGRKEALKQWKVAYRRNPFEMHAYRVQENTTDRSWGF